MFQFCLERLFYIRKEFESPEIFGVFYDFAKKILG
jgi:hypothetical protein